MSQNSSDNLLSPKEAAVRLIGFYPTITASDPEIYAAGLVHIFSHYPAHLVTEAVNPLKGLLSLHDFPPSMKQVKEFLEPRHQKEIRDAEAELRFARKRLPAPERDPEVDRKIEAGLRQLSAHLAKGFSPSSQ